MGIYFGGVEYSKAYIGGAEASGLLISGRKYHSAATTVTPYTRDAAKDISLPEGGWNAAASDGNTIWFCNHIANTARAYNASSRSRDSSKDISLGAGAWASAVSDGTTIWFVDISPILRKHTMRLQDRGTRLRIYY